VRHARGTSGGAYTGKSKKGPHDEYTYLLYLHHLLIYSKPVSILSFTYHYIWQVYMQSLHGRHQYGLIIDQAQCLKSRSSQQLLAPALTLGPSPLRRVASRRS